MEPRTIVAIEIASSKIKGAVGALSPDGRLSVLAVEEIKATNSVRHGRVQNIREVSMTVNEIIRRLESSPQIAARKVQSVVLSIGGRSLSGSPASATVRFPHDLEITEETIRRLKNEAVKDFVGNKNIEDILPRTFYVNNVEVKKVVGTFGSTLRGEFLLLTCAKETRQNLERLKFDSIRAGSVAYRLRATAIADLVLGLDDKQLGCVLVDFGAETTTVSIYKDGALCFLSTIPMGSRLITLDLMAGMTITEEAAEDMKLTLGSIAAGDSSRNPDFDEVNNYVRARAGEIVANIVNQIQSSGIAPEALAGGIVVVGGGSQLPDFGTLLAAQSKLQVRRGLLPDTIVFGSTSYAKPSNIDVISLLVSGLRHHDSDGLSAPVQETVAETRVSQPVVTPVQETRTTARTLVEEQPEESEEDDYYEPEDNYDETLLQDDPEDNEDDNRPRWSPFRSKKTQEASVRERIVYEDPEPEDEEPVVPQNHQNTKGVKKIVGRLQDALMTFFTSNPEEDDSDE